MQILYILSKLSTSRQKKQLTPLWGQFLFKTDGEKIPKLTLTLTPYNTKQHI